MRYNIHAFTEMSNDYPAYISISRDDAGKHTVTVRSAGNGGRDTVTIELTQQQLKALADDVLTDVCRERAPNAGDKNE